METKPKTNPTYRKRFPRANVYRTSAEPRRKINATSSQQATLLKEVIRTTMTAMIEKTIDGVADIAREFVPKDQKQQFYEKIAKFKGAMHVRKGRYWNMKDYNLADYKFIKF